MNPIITKLANSTARKAGHGRATSIVFGPTEEPRVIDSTAYGYRKKTTGEYVPNAYRYRFGWKNTYYQHAECTVEIPNRYQLLPP
jgi:hypothetical protein